MSVYRLLSEVAKTLRPSQEVFVLLDEVIARINKEISLHGFSAHASLGGSVAKDTFLRGDHDVDVFVRFSISEHKDDDLSELLSQVMNRFDASLVHGSRDYFEFYEGDFHIEVVPVLDISDATQAKNVTDVSPLHVRYIKESGVDTDQIRLAKQFCKAAGVYGAESYIRGFSGHVIDLLIVIHESFYELARAACSWKPPIVFDPASHHDNPVLEIPTSKHGPLLIVDPIQPFRNAAAALDDEQFTCFVDACKEFVSQPSKEFFVIKEFDEQALDKRLRAQDSWVKLLVTHDADDKRDVAGSRVRKFYERLVDELSYAEFAPVDSGWEFSYQDKSIVWFVFDTLLLSEFERRQGPPLSEEEHVLAFQEAHDDVIEEDGVLFAQVAREIRTPYDALMTALDEVSSQIPLDYEIVAGVLREQDQQ